MAVYTIVFSPTGGTKKAADLFAEAFCKDYVTIDLTERGRDFSKDAFVQEDICIVAVPSYGGRVPDAAVSRLRQMKGNGAGAILMVVYGNRDYDDTLVELQDTLTDAGFSCVAAVASIAEHSIMRQFATGRPDAQDAQELSDFAGQIRRKMEEGTGSGQVVLPGNHPYKSYGGVPMKPQAGKSCTRCGRCERECPVGAIRADDPTVTDNAACISCMRCIAVCPQKARSVSKVLLAAGSMKLKKECSGYKRNEIFLPR